MSSKNFVFSGCETAVLDAPQIRNIFSREVPEKKKLYMFQSVDFSNYLFIVTSLGLNRRGLEMFKSTYSLDLKLKKYTIAHVLKQILKNYTDIE